MGDESLPVCGQLALPKFRKQAQGRMTSCLCEPGHSGNHVYGVKVGKSIRQINALQIFEEVKRSELKSMVFAELARGSYTDEDCAGIYQVLEYVKENSK